jgi:hypothetical protein
LRMGGWSDVLGVELSGGDAVEVALDLISAKSNVSAGFAWAYDRVCSALSLLPGAPVDDVPVLPPLIRVYVISNTIAFPLFTMHPCPCLFVFLKMTLCDRNYTYCGAKGLR